MDAEQLAIIAGDTVILECEILLDSDKLIPENANLLLCTRDGHLYVVKFMEKGE